MPLHTQEKVHFTSWMQQFPHLKQQLVQKQTIAMSCSFGDSNWILGYKVFTREVVQHWKRHPVRMEMSPKVFKAYFGKAVADLASGCVQFCSKWGLD